MRLKIAILCLFLCAHVVFGEKACSPATCEALGRKCGCVDDGCEGIVCCGSCTQGATCNGAGLCEDIKTNFPKARNLRGARRAAAALELEDADPNDPWIQAGMKRSAAPEEKPLPKARNLRSGVRKSATAEAGADEDIDVSNDPWIQASKKPVNQEEQPLPKARSMRGLHTTDTGDDDQIEATNDPWIKPQQRSIGGETVRTIMDHNTYSQQKHEHEQSKEGRAARGQRIQQERADRQAAEEAVREQAVESAPDQATSGIPIAAMDHNSYSQQKHAHEQSREGKAARLQRERHEAHAARAMGSAASVVESVASVNVQEFAPSKMTHELYAQQKHAHEISREGKTARGMRRQAIQLEELANKNRVSYFNPEAMIKYGLPFGGIVGIALAAAIFIKRRQHQKQIGTYLNMNNYATNVTAGTKGRRASKHTINIAPSPVLAAQPVTPSNPSNFEHRFKQTPKLKLRTSQNLTVPNKSSPPDLKLSQTFTL